MHIYIYEIYIITNTYLPKTIEICVEFKLIY